MPKVEVLAEQLMHTDEQNLMRVYLRGQVFDMDEKDLKANVEAVPASADGKQRARTALGGRPSVKLVDKATPVSAPAEQMIVKPAPAPKPAGTEAK
jgi:hypothetical protein